MATVEVVDVKDASGETFHAMIDVDGYRLTTFRKPPEVIADIVRNLPNMPIRDDDIMLCSPAKSGTHWVSEIILMLLKGKAETIEYPKLATMLEATLESDLDKFPSPRLLNSHLPLRMLPKQLKEKKTKIVLCLRNPKDVSVSLYHFHKNHKAQNYNGKFVDHHRLFFQGKLEYGDWFDNVLSWEKEVVKGDYNIHPVYYEDLKDNGIGEIKKIAKFLDVPENDDLVHAIHDKCQFAKMAMDKSAIIKDPAKTPFKEGFSVFRKGEIGDWKNYFTVALNEEFNNIYTERMKNSKLKFRFTPAN